MKFSNARKRSNLVWRFEALEPRQLLHGLAQLPTIDPVAGLITQPPVDTQDVAGHSNDGGTGIDTIPSDIYTSAGPRSLIAIPAVALPGLPVLNTLPGAHTAIYLDFNGDAGGATTYDEDGDPTTFNAAEQQHITEAVRQIATYFAPFDVTVTTIKPTNIPYAWGVIGNNINGGYSYVGVFPNTGGPGSFNNSGDARTRESGLAHEYGHNFGLSHQSDYDHLGNKTNEYSSGYDVTHGPIMGVDFAQNVHKWFIGHPTYSPSALQDDVAVIAAAIKAREPAGGDGFRTDDYGNTIATASPLAVSGATQSASGIIERLTDTDAFSFQSDGGRMILNVNPTSPSALAPKVEVYDSTGNLLGSIDDTRQRNGPNNSESLTFDAPVAGTYYVMVKSHGDYGDLGQYTVTASALPNGWQTQDVGAPNLAGSTQFDPTTGIYTLAGSGADIYGTGDQAQYAYTSLSGDGSIIARVSSITNTDPWAKAGLDIRETTAGGSKHVYLIASESNGLQFGSRASSGLGTATNASTAAAAFTPVYLKLTRVGNTFSGYRSTDGTGWTLMGAVTLAMNTNITIGLISTSHNTGAINTATFDNVSSIDNVNIPPAYNALPAPAGLTVVPGVGTGMILHWTDNPDATGYVIERSIDGSNFTRIGTTTAGVVTYSDNGLFGSMRYFYRVSATDASGNSVPSAVVNGLNRPNAPSGVNITSWLNDQLVINWRDVSGETGYRVERSTNNINFTTIASSLGKNIPSFTDTGLATGTTYYYRVTALSLQGDSPTSIVTSTSTRLVTTTGMGFTTIASNSMTFHWATVPTATGYRVERSVDGTTFTTLANIGAVLTYTDASVTPLKEYYYRVIGTNASTEGIAPTPIFAASPAFVALPAPWKSSDVGAPAGSGAAGYAAGKFTVVANGNDIWNNSDQFRFTYMPLVGNGQIVAHVVSLENTDPWAKAGVMIRENLNGTSRDVFVSLSEANGLQLVYRNSTSAGAAISGASVTGVAPYWVKLVRTGNTFTGFVSTDNITWNAIGGALTIAMSTNAYIGLALTSHTTNTLNTAVFDNVTVSNNAPTIAVAAAAAPSTVSGGTTVLSVFGADDHGESNLTYTWATTDAPQGAPTPIFSGNGNNIAKNTIVTFGQAGVYQFTVTVSDTNGLSITSAVGVTVNQTLTSIAVTPSTVSVNALGSTPFTAVGSDQFGNLMTTPPVWTWTVTGAGNTIDSSGLLTAGNQFGSFTVSASSGTVTGTATVSVVTTIVGRSIFYNNSSYDNSDPTLNAADDNAIAPDKTALLPGQTASFANYTSYDKGINGLMLDVNALKNAALVSPADFAFNVSIDGSNWTSAPAVDSIVVRPGMGVGGSDRIEIVFPDQSIRNEWLQVTVNASVNTGLTAPDVYYFGNLVGGTGQHDNVAVVNTTDVAVAKLAANTPADLSSITDFNRNGVTNITDISLAKLNNQNSIPLFTASLPVATLAATAIARTAVRATPSVTRAPGGTRVTTATPFSVVFIRPSTSSLALPRKKSDLW